MRRDVKISRTVTSKGLVIEERRCRSKILKVLGMALQEHGLPTDKQSVGMPRMQSHHSGGVYHIALLGFPLDQSVPGSCSVGAVVIIVVWLCIASCPVGSAASLG
jgi:hypothetical protein